MLSVSKNPEQEYQHTLCSPHAVFSQGCSNNISALGRSLGFFLKHCFKKSSIKGLQISGIGGDGSATMRYITEESRDVSNSLNASYIRAPESPL
jgi:hypothetical protein